MNPRAGGEARRREYKNWMAFNNPLAPTGPGGTGQLQGPVNYPPPGGWQAGRTVNPRAVAAAARRRNAPPPQERIRFEGPNWPFPQGLNPDGTPYVSPLPPAPRPRGWQLGGEVGASPEEVAMASEIFARATPEQKDQITGGGGPGMMDEEAAIGEALAMAMGGGGGGPLMNGGGPPMNGGGPPMGGPPMGGPPMNGAPPMGGLI